MELRYANKKIPILFENDSFFVLDKPSGLAVQGGEGVKVSLDSILSEHVFPRPFLVHRLDRDTSGIILVAKTREAASQFSCLFMERTRASGSGRNSKSDGNDSTTNKPGGIVKQYLGVCLGIPVNKKGIIRIELDAQGKKNAGSPVHSETAYRLLLSGETALPLSNELLSFSLLELELGTGRMHQIRRHLAKIGNPLLGDDKYGIFQMNKKLRKAIGLKHLLLHASRLIIPPLPLLIPDGLDVTAVLPEYFAPFIHGPL